jgi:peptidyl-prolyl cis-trans isomerase SurA
MRKLVLSCAVAGLTLTSSQAQTLFTYGGKPVSKQEFLKVYQKNSINKTTDFSEPALREYLDLYSLFKMKVQEAELIHLDTMQSLAAELNNYRHQLSKNYLTDKEVGTKLVREAYDRMKSELHVSHILISVSPNASPEDTAKAYARIDSMYKAVTKGKADFAALATANSDDRGSRPTGGDIGYLSALQTPYAFENAAYNTPVGKVSAPFRTMFGYHIIKVTDKRPARGEVQVAHILLSTPKSRGEEAVTVAKKRADSLENLLHSGVSFDTLVKHFSEDKITVNEGGVLPAFGAGRMVPAFENAAFALKQPGDYSAPVKTDYGYHIIKLIGRVPLKPLDSMQDDLRKRVENDGRNQVAQEMFMAKIKQQNNFKEYPAALEALKKRFNSLPDTGANAGRLNTNDFKDMNDPVFELGGNKYLQTDFMQFAETLTRGRINGPKGSVIGDIYRLYVDRTVNDYEEHRLTETNPDFRSLMEEYRNGIMIFEMMDRNVWGKAGRDTTGLKAFYMAHPNKYMWEPGFTGAVYHFKDEASMKKGLTLLQQKGGVKDSVLNKALNPEGSAMDAFSVDRGRYEFSRFKDVPQSSIQQGKLSPAVKVTDGTYTVVLADKVYSTPSPKTLDEARGYAVAEYQDVLEKTWNSSLRSKYPVKVDETVFRSMVK